MYKNKSDELTRELKVIRKENKVRKKTSYRKNSSKLDKYLGEIMRMRFVHDATLEEIKRWLKKHKRLNVCRSTILRRINQWVNGER